MACNVICVSREAGAGGEQVARLVATELGFAYVDEEIVASAAASSGLDPAAVADEERRRSLARRVLDAIVSGGADMSAFGGAVPLPADDWNAEIRSFIREAVTQAAGRGDVVIVAHAASFAVGPRPSVLRVLVAASPAARAGRMGEQDGLDEGAATRTVRESDAARADYLKRFYDVDRELPIHYDLVLNTDALGVERAARIVVEAARIG